MFVTFFLIYQYFVFLLSVLQECATDSEELIYPLRAPSSCSAPPDLLLTGDREPIIGSRIPANNQKDVKVTSQKKTRVVGISPEQMLLEVSRLFFPHIYIWYRL